MKPEWVTDNVKKAWLGHVILGGPPLDKLPYPEVDIPTNYEWVRRDSDLPFEPSEEEICTLLDWTAKRAGWRVGVYQHYGVEGRHSALTAGPTSNLSSAITIYFAGFEPRFDWEFKAESQDDAMLMAVDHIVGRNPKEFE